MQYQNMKRKLMVQILILLSISSLVYADDIPTYSIEQSLDKPRIRDGVIEIKPVQQRKIGDTIKIERKLKKHDNFKSDLEAFKVQARSAGCSDRKNRLFLIDSKLVFWEVAGNCPDGSYGLILYDKSNHQALCSLRDSIAGPIRTINDSKYESLFDVIIQNLKESNLGLSPDHIVEEISLTD